MRSCNIKQFAFLGLGLNAGGTLGSNEVSRVESFWLHHVHLQVLYFWIISTNSLKQ